MSMTKILLTLPDELLEEIDRKRGDVKRTAWIRSQLTLSVGSEWPPPQRQPGPDVTNIRSSSQAKRGIKPYEKPGKRR